MGNRWKFNGKTSETDLKIDRKSFEKRSKLHRKWTENRWGLAPSMALPSTSSSEPEQMDLAGSRIMAGLLLSTKPGLSQD
jgi:hypothetical protein